MQMLVELEGYSGFDTLHMNSWSDAIYKLDTIKKYHMEEQLLEELEIIFGDCEPPTEVQVNDWLCFEFDAERFVAENTAFNTITDIDELEDYSKNLYFNKAQATITEVRQQDKEEKLWQYLQNNFDMRNLLEVMEELEEFDFDELEEE